MGKDKSHKKDKEHKDKDKKSKRKSQGGEEMVIDGAGSPVAAAPAASSMSPPPLNADAKVSKKSKKDKKDKERRKSSSKHKSPSPAAADALLEALADKDVIVGKKDEEDDLMQMDVDTDGKIKGGTAAGAKLIKDGQVVTGALVPFAKPLAEGKLAKKVLKTVKKGTA